MPNGVKLSLLPLLVALAPLAGQESHPNVRCGLPSPAKAEAGQREDYLIERPQYVLSYKAEKRTPNWVSWRLRTHSGERDGPVRTQRREGPARSDRRP
jgi:DNA/RNA endonuclease G (NUC1)